MKKIIRFLSATAVFATAAVVHAQVYFEASVAGLNAQKSVQAIHYEAKPSIFSGLIGYQIHPNLAIEGYLGAGAGNATMTENGINYGEEFNFDSSFGVFAKPRLEVSNDMELFMRLGYLQNKISYSNINKMMLNEAQSSVAVGLGANYYFDSRTYVTGSYVSYNNKSGFKLNGLSIGLGYKF